MLLPHHPPERIHASPTGNRRGSITSHLPRPLLALVGMDSLEISPAELLRDGLLSCRAGDWRSGLDRLTRLAQLAEGEQPLPSLFYSYLGVAMARCEGRKQEGLELCRYAVKLGPAEPENRLNLARIYLLQRNRRQAVKQLHVGLRLDPSDRRLRAFQDEIGKRRPIPIRFLDRDNFLNVWIGWLTYQLERKRSERQARKREEDELARLADE